MSIILDGSNGTTTPGLYSTTTFTGTYTDGIVADYTTGLGRISVGSSDGIAFYNGGVANTQLMRLDSSGNLGLGVSLSNWNTVTPVFQIGGGASLYGFGSEVRLNTNYYYSSGDKYIGNGYAASYNQAAGAHKWFTAGNNTSGAGAAITTFNQAMTLDASGNLLVGATSATYSASGRGLVEINGSSTSLLALKTGGSAAGYMYHDGTALSLVNTKASYIQFTTNSIDAARIDSSGNLLVGNTSSYNSGTRLQITNNGNSAPIGWFYNSNSVDFTASALRVEVNKAAATTFELFSGYNSAAKCFTVYGNGNVQNTNNSYGALSDIKLKENIIDATPKLAQLNQVRVVNYNLIGDETKQIGVIAQELEQVFPSMIEETPDRDEEGNVLGTTTKSVKYSVFVPMLIKAIQEQQAIIETMTNRITALESK